MAIQSVRVVSKYIRTCERFTDFLHENVRWVEGGKLNTTNLDSIAFALNNASNLRMYTQGSDRDLLALTTYSGMTPHVTVTYLERLEDEGDEYFSPLGTEDFPLNGLVTAMECFMARWFSANPEKVIKPLVEKPARLYDHVGFILTPDQIEVCLNAMRMTKLPANVKHLDPNTNGDKAFVTAWNKYLKGAVYVPSSKPHSTETPRD